MLALHSTSPASTSLASASLASARIASALVLLATVAAAAQSGCNEAAATRPASRRGEACQARSDCEDGLYCAPLPSGGGGLCVTGEFRVAPTAKECAIIECTSGLDCCEGAVSGCVSGRIDCERGRCVSRCASDRDCSVAGAGRRCAGGNCVQCAADSDCQPGLHCVTGSCLPPCTGDGDCAGFDRCLAGRCIASGCQTDRECVASTRNVDARCGTDGKCIVPCQTDLECGNPTSYAFFSCIEGQCTYVGCESDKDCRLFFAGPSDASALPAKQHPVCRERGLGDVVTPGP